MLDRPSADDPQPQMAELIHKLLELATLIPHGKPVVYLDYPVHLNIGDLLIERGTEALFRAAGHKVVRCRSAHDCGPAFVRRIDPEATIVLHGGGNFGDLYDLHQRFREWIVATCRRNRIVLLPQTIHFESAARLAGCARIFSDHPDLHLCARDERSYALLRRHFSNPAYLYPDMAHLLWDEFAPLRARAGRGELVFARSDKERRAGVDLGFDSDGALDWGDIFTWTERAMCRPLHSLHAAHKVALRNREIYPLWRRYRNHLIGKSARFTARYESIATDRLHMVLLGLMVGRHVVMGDNSYGKLSAYHACWLRDVPTVRLSN